MKIHIELDQDDLKRLAGFARKSPEIMIAALDELAKSIATAKIYKMPAKKASKKKASAKSKVKS